MKVRRKLFFALQRMIGSHAGDRYADLKGMERWPTALMQEWQSKQIRSLIDHAVEHVPFYRERFGGRKDVPPGELPVVTKEELSSHFLDLMTPELRREYVSGVKPKGYGWLEVTSGGTTGVPTTVIHDPEFRDKDRAARVYEMGLSGIPYGKPHFKLWGSMNDIQETRASWRQRVMTTLSREVLLNAFEMSDQRIVEYISMINQHRIQHAIAYVDAAAAMAAFIRKHGLFVRPLKSIMTTGGTLTEDTRELLQEVFRARIHNKYGSRDCGELACECEAGGLHVLAPNVFIEILDKNDKPLPPGELGRVVVTFLGNRAFPILRFDIGDMAAMSSGACPCGRGFPVLERLEGRAVDFLLSGSGGFVSPVYIRHVVGVVHGPKLIRRFQFVQEDLNIFSLTIQPESGVKEYALQLIREPLLKDLRKVLGPQSEIAYIVTNHIPETAAGKFRYTINRYTPPQ